MIYLYLFGTCFHFIYVFMIIGKNRFRLLCSCPIDVVTLQGRYADGLFANQFPKCSFISYLIIHDYQV